MQRLENISRPPNSPRHRKMLFPPIEVNNKSTGLLARTLGPSGPLIEKRSNLDETRGTPYASSRRVGVLTGADVFAPPPPKTYRRLIGTPPPRSLRNARKYSEGDIRESSLVVGKDDNFPTIRIQNYDHESRPSQKSPAAIDHDDLANNPFVPTYSADFRLTRPPKMSTTEVNNDDDDDEDEDDDDEVKNFLYGKEERSTTPVGTRRMLQPPPRMMTWKSDGALVNDWRNRDWEPSKDQLSLSADFAAIKHKMQSNKMKASTAPIKLVPLKGPTITAHQDEDL